MKNLTHTYILASLGLMLFTSIGFTQTQTENYIKTTTYQVKTLDGTTNTETNAALSQDDRIMQVNYVDGLGRPEQSIGVRQTPDKKDLVTFMEYDAFGRQLKEYLPYATTQTSQNIRTSALTDLEAYYLQNYASDLNTSSPNPYSESLMEASPLNRMLKQASPGESWAIGSGHEIEMAYQTNVSTDAVKLYEVNFATGSTESPTLVDSGLYGSGELYKTITYDENHTAGKDHSTEEYKDKMDRVILKRTYNNEIEHDTYYIYDDYGNLSYVLPPLVDTSITISQTILDDLCYQYRYDHRNRLIEKKVPGKGWEYIVYNKLDQPVLTQDANMRINDEWLFTKYDDFKRVAYTGMMYSTSTRTAMQLAANDLTTNTEINETRLSSSITIAGTTIYYTNDSFPKAGITELHSISYYDSYVDHAPLSLPTGSIYGQTIETDVTSLPTVSKVRILGTSLWITSLTAYNTKGRAIYSATRNALHATTDSQEIELDFIGKVLETKSIHTDDKQSPITIIEYFTYDHQGRLLTHSHKVNSNAMELLASNEYDELGQLITKGVGNTVSNPLQEVDYEYNVRGWLKDINNIDNIGSDLFSFRLHYDKPNHTEATDLFNGNISQTNWKTANTNSSIFWYVYQYDALNRITKGQFAGGGHWNRYTLRDVTYDKNGNLTYIKRLGATNSQATTFGDIDRLNYIYNGNKLNRVDDLVTNNNKGFFDGNQNSTDFFYDLNGNMIIDKNKGITSIQYNHLNLPEAIEFNNSVTQKIEYIYSADGVKQRKIVNKDGNVTSTSYAGNYIYENTSNGETLKFFNTAEGYVEPKNTTGGFNYVYQYKDHLGNIRLSYSDSDNNGAVDSSEIIEENNYYPFGLEHKGYNNVVNGTENNYQTFLGQEKNEELGLNWLTFRYRNYMPEIGRFFGVDPVSSEYMSISTYQFAHNNPIWKIEIEGLEGESINIPDKITHEPIKVEQARGNPYITAAGGNKVVQETTKEVVKKSGNLSKVMKVGAKAFGLAAAFLTDYMSPNMGTTSEMVGTNRDPNNYAIDEKLRVDDKQQKTEGQSDSPIQRLGEADGFDIVDQDDDTAVISTEVDSETLIIGGDFSLENDVLTINNFDMEGSEGNKVGIKALRGIVKQIGTELGVGKVVINGAARTTGANPGKTPSLEFDISKL